MQIRRRYLAVAVGLGISVWVLDAAADAFLFYSEQSFLALLVTEVPFHELYIRTVIMVVFLGAAIGAARQARQRRAHEQEASLFRRLIDEAHDSVYVIDPDTGQIEDVNETASNRLGYDRSTLTEMSVADINPAFDEAEEFVEFMSSSAGQTLNLFESTHVAADGSTVPIEVSAETVDTNGTTHRVAIARDISDRRARERQITHYKQAVESSRDLLTAIDSDRRYLFANDAYRTFHALDHADIRGETVDSVLDDDELDLIEPHIQAAMDGDRVRFETTRTHARRGERVLDVRYWPLRDADGTIHGVGASMRDVTDRREILEDLRQSRQKYESLFQSIRDAIIVVDTDRQIINCNQAFTELFGYSLDEIEGRPSSILSENADEFDAIGDSLTEHRDEPRFVRTFQLQKKSGQTFPAEANVFYLRDRNGEIAGYIGLIRDVSGRRARTSQIQTIDRVLRHNLNNALTVIIGSADAITADMTDDPAADAARIVNRAQQLQSLAEKEREITQFLSESRQIVEQDVVAIVEAVVDDLRERHPTATVSVDLPPAQSVRTVTYLNRAIEELLTNAVIHSDKESPTVDISLETTDDIVSIHIADQGPGIPEIEQRVLTSEHDIEPLFHGQGMGLWLVHLIVQYSDGTIDIGENDPCGTVVTVRLPAGDEQATDPDRQSSQAVDSLEQ